MSDIWGSADDRLRIDAIRRPDDPLLFLAAQKSFFKFVLMCVCSFVGTGLFDGERGVTPNDPSSATRPARGSE